MKLLVFDVEGTIFEPGAQLPGTSLSSTIWQAIAIALGPEAVEEELATHASWERGEYPSYLDWMRATIEIHRRHGLTEETFKEIVARPNYVTGVREFFERLPRGQFVPLLVSGGFRELSARAERDLGIQHSFAACAYDFGKSGLIENFTLLPSDFGGKLQFVRQVQQELGLATEDWIFVGDGNNDVEIARRAPLSVGYRPAPKLAEVVSCAVREYAEILPIIRASSAAGRLQRPHPDDS
jgi:phosphoserine phosphatase